MLSNTVGVRSSHVSVFMMSILGGPTLQGLFQNVSQDVSQDVWQTQAAHQSDKNYVRDDYIFEFENDYIFVFDNEVNEKTTVELDDVLEENYMTVCVRTINGKTISIKCDKKQTATISDEVERRSLILRDMTYFAHQRKVMIEKKTKEENNIEAEAALEMSLRLLGGMEKSEPMDTLESEEDREKKRKLEEMCEGKLTRPSEDAMFLRKEIIDALNRSDEKWKVTQRKPTKR